MFWCVGVLQASEEFSINLLKNAESDDQKKLALSLQESSERAAGELLNGVGIHQELVVAVAQKALDG